MKKSILIASLLVIFSIGAMAQKDNTVSIGVKGGLNMPQMMYFKNAYLSRLPQAYQFKPTGGVFVDIPFNEIVALAPEFDYVQRGTDIAYEHLSGTQVHYIMDVTYVDFRLPLEFRLPIKPYLQPFAQVGAEGGRRMGGTIHIDRTQPVTLDATIDVGDANMTKIHAGVFGGVGIRSLLNVGYTGILLKLTASYHQGVLDTYTSSEMEESVPAVNVNAYQITGSRLPQGLEVCLSIGIPLKAKPDDACSSFSRDRYRRHGNRRHLFGF
ncbi:MAG: PorT family protein [Bacteroidales bacterium]|nr:PorT family protein [Bacteroidales bacterium]